MYLDQLIRKGKSFPNNQFPVFCFLFPLGHLEKLDILQSGLKCLLFCNIPMIYSKIKPHFSNNFLQMFGNGY